jgi:hypothetical protein
MCQRFHLILDLIFLELCVFHSQSTGPEGDMKVPSRDLQIDRLHTKEPFDVLIIGGGATGD